MELIKRLEPLAAAIIFLGALNWGILGLFGENVLADIFGSGTGRDVVYTIVGFAGLVYLPRVLAMFARFETHFPRPRGA
jgi:uncharacterized membrane protein YuzA (DUF378 family)